MTKSELTAKIKSLALEAGFHKVGIAPPRLPDSRGTDLAEWLKLGFAGEMSYLERDGLKRARPTEVLQGAKSVISLALNYYHPDEEKPGSGFFGRIARYARGRDYHAVIEKKLKRLIRALEEAAGPGFKFKRYVDTGPIMEKAFAQEAGIGFYGKNTNILTADLGSWIFLANLITDMELEFDAPHAGGCGSCRLCLDACPTGALIGPYKIDATRCISYWTIESKQDQIPAAVASKMGDWAFGCDICQDVCPYNRKAKLSSETDFAPAAGKGAWLDLEKINSLPTDAEFQIFAQGTPLKRPKRKGLLRNAKAILTNLGSNL